MKSILLTSVLFSVLYLIAPVAVFACSCSERQNLQKEFESSALVFKGKITAIEGPKPQTETNPFGNSGSSSVIVERVYKGALKIGDRLTFTRGNGVNCNYTFGDSDVGQTWLFYLDEQYPKSVFDEASGKWKETEELTNSVSFCGRSGEISTSGHDLAYLDNLEKFKGKNRLSGKLMYGRDLPNISGMRVKIIGKRKTYVARVVESSFFEIYDIPNGEYLVEFETPEGWKLSDNFSSEFTDHPGRFANEGLKKNQRRVFMTDGHYGLDFALEPDTLITGRLLSTQGKPITNVCISAVEIDAPLEKYAGYACSDEAGLFRFNAIDTGSYHLVVNRDGKISSRHPFGRVFYPGVFQRSDAGVLYVGPGRYITKANIQIPQMTRLIEISGNFIFADGHPIERGKIVFNPEDKEKYDSIETGSDETGKFVIKIPFGVSGTLTGEQHFRNNIVCPEIIAALESAKSNYLETPPLSISGIEPLTNATLKFPFDFCEKEKK
jgi:hypothetical protein